MGPPQTVEVSWIILLVLVFILLMKAIMVMWLINDRTQQRRRDGEMYHTIRNILAPVSGQLGMLQILNGQLKTIVRHTSDEIKEEVVHNPEKTSSMVVEKMTKTESGIHKKEAKNEEAVAEQSSAAVPDAPAVGG